MKHTDLRPDQSVIGVVHVLVPSRQVQLPCSSAVAREGKRFCVFVKKKKKNNNNLWAVETWRCLWKKAFKAAVELLSAFSFVFRFFFAMHKLPSGFSTGSTTQNGLSTQRGVVFGKPVGFFCEIAADQSQHTANPLQPHVQCTYVVTTRSEKASLSAPLLPFWSH